MTQRITFFRAALVACLMIFVGSLSAQGIREDEFTGALDLDVWRYVNPLGDCTQSMTGTHAQISVPAGVGHDPYDFARGGNRASRIVQQVADPIIGNLETFIVFVKFDGVQSVAYQMQGITVIQDEFNYIRCEIYSDGTTLNYLMYATLDGGAYDDLAHLAGPIGVPLSTTPLLIKLERSSGSVFTQSYTTDEGGTWTPVASFTHGMRVDSIGVYAANAGTSVAGPDAPAFTGLIDYFRIVDPTPIQLSSLSATLVSNNHVRIDWTTLSETNNFGFNVQKARANSTTFVTIPNSFVEGNGTTIAPHSYSYLDATATVGVWQYRLEQIDLDGPVHYTEPVQVNVVTSVSDKKMMPTEFALRQNFPNPFNPSTKITYDVPKESRVKLEVYNLIGQNVATLLDEVKPAGRHTVEFNARSMTSGVYLYKLSTAGITFTKKMVLMK